MPKDKKKIPKRIAGVKLPKEVRRKGEALLDAANSPAGREAIAKGLTIAATVANLAAQKGAARRNETAAKPEGLVAEEAAPSPAPAPDPQKLAEAVSTVADAVLGRLFGKR